MALDQAHRAAHLVDGVGDAEAHCVRDADVGREARDLASTSRAGDVGTRAVHARAGDPPLVDRVAQRDVGEGTERPDVAHRGEAGVDRALGVADAEQCGVRLALHQDVAVRAGLDLAGEVGVQVDQARRHDTARQVKDGAVRRRCVTGDDVGHAFTVEDDGDVRPHLSGDDVSEPAAASGNERVSCYESSHGAEPATTPRHCVSSLTLWPHPGHSTRGVADAEAGGLRPSCSERAVADGHVGQCLGGCADVRYLGPVAHQEELVDVWGHLEVGE